MKVFLVSPYNVGKFGLQNIFNAEPLGLEVIAASLDRQHDVRITDLRWEPNLERTIKEFEPDVVGISCLYTSHTRPVWDLARRTKAVDPKIRVVVGGHPPTLAPEFFASSNIDAVVVGDGELTMPEYCAALEKGTSLEGVAGLVLNGPKGQVRTAKRGRPSDLRDTPRPLRNAVGVDRRRHYLSLSRPVGLMEVTRGCPFTCNFCSIWRFAESKVRSLDVKAAVDEIASLDETAIFFVDDHFFVNPTYMMELGKALADAKLGKSFNVQSRADAIAKHPELIDVWKEAGLHVVFFGLEGHDDARLESVNKATTLGDNDRGIKVLQEKGVGVVGNLMVDPKFTKKDFANLRDYVRAKNYHFATYCIATPFPGTGTFRDRAREIDTWNFDLYDIQHAVIQTTLPLEQFYEEYASLWQLRAELQPPTRRWYTAKRFVQMIFQQGLNLELLRNARRFDRIVKDPKEYHEDHAAVPEMGWPQEAMAAGA